MDSTSEKNQEKCSCDKAEKSQESDSSTSEASTTKEKKSRMSLMALGFNFRRGRSLHSTTKRKQKAPSNNELPSNANGPLCLKKSPKWGIKFNCTKKEPKVAFNPEDNQNCCKCTCYKKKEEPLKDDNSEAGVQIVEESVAEEVPNVVEDNASSLHTENSESESVHSQGENEPEDPNGIYSIAAAQPSNFIVNGPFVDMHWIRTIHEDCDEAARLARAREIEQGVEAPANFRPVRRVQLLCSDIELENGQMPRRLQLVCPPDLSVDSLRALFQKNVTLRSCPLDNIGCHTQVDFIHCLVPDLLDITNCSFYWGKMDRYEAERLLEGRREGTFLLRDSAQEEFLFSVSFRKYGRSLHARIEQWNHKFSFDSHDPGVYTSGTVCGLIDNYKDPSSCMFFEPMLTWPLHRNFSFSLQHLSRASIVNRLTYDNINHLQLPKTLKSYLKEYHYRQKVRVEQFDDDFKWFELRN